MRNKIKDENLLWLLDEIIDSTVGIPIGNYLSQYFGNLYLSGLDHYCKTKIKHYYRYADDIVVFHADKQNLHAMKLDIEKYLNVKLKLQMKENWQVFPVRKRGVDFLGYRFFPDYILLRNSIKKRFIKTVNRVLKKHENLTWTTIINGVMSYYGWFKYGNCRNLQNKYFNEELKQIIKNTCEAQGINNPFKKVA